MTSIDWPRVQARLGVKADGIAGQITYTALLAYAASRPADDTIRSMGRAMAQWAVLYGMTMPARLAEFVAQICNETGGFRKFEENLSYSAARLQQIWPSRVKTVAQAQQLARNPEALANVVYARPAEGNTQPGDGWRYRGRGALQLTFRNNYRRFGTLLHLPLEDDPDMATDPAVSVQIALEFFRQGGVNDAVDRGDFTKARKITNGGTIGLAEVAAIRNRLLGVLS